MNDSYYQNRYSLYINGIQNFFLSNYKLYLYASNVIIEPIEYDKVRI